MRRLRPSRTEGRRCFMANPYTKPTIAIDMDHVMADTGAYLCDWLNDRFSTSLEGESFSTLLATLPDEQRAPLYDLVEHGGLMRELPLMDGCMEAMRALAEDFELIICTAAMEFPNCIPPKIDWLREHFGWIDEKDWVFCGHKQVMGTDYLIDDSPKHFDGFSGQGLLFTAAHNTGETRFPRADDWSGVLDWFSAQPR